MKLNYKRTCLIGLAFLSISAFWQLYDTIIPLILKNTFHVGESFSGVVMALDNILALFLLPFFGALSDRHNTRLGQRTPFIIVGTALAFIGMMMLSFANDSVHFVLFMIALIITLVSMGIYRAPAVALMPSLTPKPLYSKANAIINLMGAVGAVITLMAIKTLLPKTADTPAYFPLFALVGGLMVMAVIVLVLTVKERKISDEMKAATAGDESGAQPDQAEAEKSKKNPPLPRPVFKSLMLNLFFIAFFFLGYNAVTTWFSTYAQTRWQMVGGGFAGFLMIGTVSSIVAYIPIGILATKIGRKKTILGGLFLMGLVFVIAGLFTTYVKGLEALFVLMGFGYAAVIVNALPMVVNMSRDSDVGRYTGYYYTFSMSAQILTPIISGALLERVGYWTLFPYAAVFMAISFVIMLFVKHGDTLPDAPKDKMEFLNVDD